MVFRARKSRELGEGNFVKINVHGLRLALWYVVSGMAQLSLLQAVMSLLH